MEAAALVENSRTVDELESYFKAYTDLPREVVLKHDLLRDGQPLGARGGGGDDEAAPLEKAPRHLHVVRVVVNDDDPFGHPVTRQNAKS